MRHNTHYEKHKIRSVSFALYYFLLYSSAGSVRLRIQGPLSPLRRGVTGLCRGPQGRCQGRRLEGQSNLTQVGQRRTDLYLACLSIHRAQTTQLMTIYSMDINKCDSCHCLSPNAPSGQTYLPLPFIIEVRYSWEPSEIE